MRKILGIFLLSLPLLWVFVLSCVLQGLTITLGCFGIAGLVIVTIMAGCWHTFGD